MIVGIVNAHREATIRIIMLDNLGGLHEIDVVVDTGFNGSLTLPASIIAYLEAKGLQ